MRAYRIRTDERGAAAVEFAMMLPLLCLMAFGAIALCIGLWNGNALEAVTAQTARCLAIGSSDCGSAPSGCTAAAGPCFAVQIAAARGLRDVTPDQVTVQTVVLDGISYTSVEIAYPYNLLGYSVLLTSTSRFPHPS